MSQSKKLSALLHSKRAAGIAVAIGFAAIVLIFLSSYIDFGSAWNKDTAEEYTQALTSQLLDIVTLIDGVGDAEIFLTMENEGENVYLNNSDTKTKSIAPTVRGVVVVCDGGDDPVVVSRVLSAVTKSLSISSDKVCITKLNHNGGI